MFAFPSDNSFARMPATCFAHVAPEPAPAPRLLAWNAALAEELGLPPGDDDTLARVFSGTTVPPGAEPLAMAYAGHQFGQFVPRLGDGRAHLLAEVIDRAGRRRDIALKGSGRTPFSRGGDGRAWLGPVLREYLVSEAMHAMGIPTTRALAAVATGREVLRERPLPGAVLTRVAASHIRVGSFEYHAARGDTESLAALFEHARARHWPAAADIPAFLDAVIAAQARLVARWLGVGFIHGVMNTDNTAISGETIDYGPCAFMDDYHPARVFSSIDHMGRYAYGNQPKIIIWNMARLASALIPLMDDEEDAVRLFTERVGAMAERLQAEWLAVFAAKIGIAHPEPDDAALVADLLARMAAGRADFTNVFRGLADGSARDSFADPTLFDDWAPKWRSRLAGETDSEAVMARANPQIIPRNHLVERVIEAAVEGDMEPFETLLAAVTRPFEPPTEGDFTRPPAPDEAVTQTFCGT